MTQLHLDLHAPISRMDAVWSFGGNVGAAPLLLRKDLRRHLLMCRDELGFRHVRCQGMLGPAMVAGRPDGSFDFDKVESVLDWMMESGLVPFFALSSGPSLASPWPELVRALAVHVDGRYGCDAREWYFELCSDTGAEAFTRYDSAARTIKQVHPEYRVGGPAARGSAGLDAFLAHVAGPSADLPPDASRCDFVTLDADGADDADPADGTALTITGARQKVSATLGEHVPLIVVGPDRAAGLPSFERDECNRAAFVARTAAEASSGCQGIVHRNVSDINDEQGWRFEPFHAGGGLITVNDVRKSAFHAQRLLHEHGGYHSEGVPVRWTDPVPGLGCLATRSEHTLRLLLWLQREPGATVPTGPARLTIEGLPASVRTAHVQVIRPGAGSAFEAWVQLGRPPFVNREVLDTLEVASQPALADVDFHEYPPRLEPGMVMQLTMQLPFGDD